MKKLNRILLVSIILLVGACAVEEGEKKKPENEEITLHIIIKDEVNQKELFDNKISVKENVETLADFLEKAEDLNVVMEDGQYGKVIMEMKGVKTENFNKGPWWLYDSENNDSCKATGICEAASSLNIKDGDSFIFRFTDSFE